MIGPVYDIKEKIALLAKSKLFLLPSFEENWTIVVGEALTAGLPVIAYDLLEINQVWGEHVSWIPKGDTEIFAAEVIKLLSDNEYYHMCAGKGINFMKQFDWNDIAERQLELCTKLI
jgi:glycosyltransferase involved in cell wall biosynthesis